MILQALNQYYERKVALGDGTIAPFGFSPVKIPVVFELGIEGRIVQIKITDRKETTQRLVPQSIQKTSGIASNLLWENAEYALGMCSNGSDEKTKKRHKEFIRKIKSLPEPASSDKGIISLINFLNNFVLSDIQNDSSWEYLKQKPNVSFQLQGDSHLICERPAVIDTIKNAPEEEDHLATCLISGNKEPIARLHDPIKNVWNAQSSGARIVSFNLDSFRSFGKEQGDNSPISKKTSFAYTTALNYLLREGSGQRMQVGDASTVFWAENNPKFESDFGGFFSSTPKEIKDDPDAYTRSVKAVFDSVCQGQNPTNESADRFYVLGLSPNISRISIRFWQVATVAEISQRIKQHFNDLSMAHSEYDMPYLPLFYLLKNLAVLGKSENIPPNLAGEVMQSILTGKPYPQTMLSAAIKRCKAEQKINYPRAAIIKACINRSQSKEELKVTLDVENTNPAYRLGRLFAVLEKIQEEANPGINATIKDRYYGAASSNPVSVFATLLKLKNHHLSKFGSIGRKINLEKLIGEIMCEIPPALPVSLDLQDQGRFAVGYYHQRHDLFTSKPTQQSEEQS